MFSRERKVPGGLYPLVAIVIGMIVSIASPEDQWLRLLNATLWCFTFGAVGWWLSKEIRAENISRRLYDVTLHFWLLCGVFTYGSIYAAVHDYPVPPTVWIIAAIQVSLLVRLIVFDSDQ